jgi:organic radical activating enzyme
MKLTRNTISLCTTCYKEIPALITIGPEGVVMRKECSAHGEQTAVVEPDPVFYTLVNSLRCPSIYDGYFVDVTRRCNMRCNTCYFPLEEQDPDGLFSLDSIVEDCTVNARRAPFILTGGEPTIRGDIAKVIEEVSKIGPVELLTNGVRLADPELFQQVMPLLIAKNGVANLNLSIHPESDKWREVVEMCRKDEVKIESALLVIDSKESFQKAIAQAQELSDVVLAFRIKAATKIWAEQKPADKIFVSHMLNWLEEMGGYKLVPQRQNKSVFVNVIHNSNSKPVLLMLVSWHDVNNVDLMDIDCPPFYRARNGQVANFVTAALINEGMEAGWLNGRRM